MTTPKVERVPARQPNRRDGVPCEGDVSEALRKWAARIGKQPKCSFAASYLVNGRGLCERHAGKELLRLMLEPQAPITLPCGCNTGLCTADGGAAHLAQKRLSCSVCGRGMAASAGDGRLRCINDGCSEYGKPT